MAKNKKQPYISASEIGTYVYCRRAWWLRQVAGFESRGKDAAFAHGTAAHLKHGLQVRRAHQQSRVALFLLGLGFLLLIIALSLLVHL